jgi:hypothetical protein
VKEQYQPLDHFMQGKLGRQPTYACSYLEEEVGAEAEEVEDFHTRLLRSSSHS